MASWLRSSDTLLPKLLRICYKELYDLEYSAAETRRMILFPFAIKGNAM